MLRDQADRFPLPPVDPKDLACVWSLISAGRPPGHFSGAVGYDHRLLMQVCKPGSDVYAVFLRTMLLHLLTKQSVSNNWQDDEGHLLPHVFEMAANYALPHGLKGLDCDAFPASLRARFI
jgi:hypothetical protein